MTFKIGDTLKCLRYVQRRDGISEINPGNTVKVIQAYGFTTREGEQLQDIMVQRGHDAPITVIPHAGVFERIESNAPKP